jgi:predicted metal-dependent HD superfamily phosphohydrolase
MNYSQLLEDVKDEVTQLFQNAESGILPYHNLTHTRFVVSKAAEIARHYELNDRDFFIVLTAAWFHDSGYLSGHRQGHEERSAAMAETFLQARELDSATIQQVKDCILATRIPQLPNNQLEQIVCDADLFHLGTGSFGELNKKMKKEAELDSGKKIGKKEWLTGTLNLFEQFQYQTGYAKKLLGHIKQENINSIKLKLTENKTGKKSGEDESTVLTNTPPDKATADNKERSKKPDRSVETMFRISSGNHQRLSDMADNKAHIMITTTSIILSILLSVLLRKLEDNPYLVIPAMLLLAVCVTTMVFSILATRPVVPNGRFTRQDIEDKKTNLLFFGNFFRMSYAEYSEGMEAMMNDRGFLYGSITRDIYSQGIVLGRKYRLLRIGYNVFMFGIVCSVLAFAIAVIVAMY